MPGKRAVRNIFAFVRGMLERDRYLTEVVSSVITFLVGVLASLALPVIDGRPVMAGFREMPMPELWVVAATIPGTIAAIRVWRESGSHEGRCTAAVMASFWLLACTSLACDLNNWVFWTFLALLLGLMQGYAIVTEWTEMRWGVAWIASFFSISFVASIIDNSEWPFSLLVAPAVGWALMNLLSVSRLSARRV